MDKTAKKQLFVRPGSYQHPKTGMRLLRWQRTVRSKIIGIVLLLIFCRKFFHTCFFILLLFSRCGQVREIFFSFPRREVSNLQSLAVATKKLRAYEVLECYNLYTLFYMKKIFLILFIICGWLSGCSENEKDPSIWPQSEVTLFDKQTKPIAYISYTDRDSTIYMWDGIPVAYMVRGEEIYHFNGRFLGWYRDGVLYDREGYAVAARKGVMRGEVIMNSPYTQSGVKGVKHIQPIRHIRALRPAMPRFRDEWSRDAIPLCKFFLMKITWFDKDKKAVAYLDYGDDSTIYMWDGRPVAYVEEKEKIYRFDGRFLGWYVDKVVYDQGGYAVGAEEGVWKGSISMLVPQLEPIKGIQLTKPVKHVPAVAPVFPHFENEWSKTSLTDFFLSE